MLAWIRSLKPIFIENSRVPVLLSYVAPININAISFGNGALAYYNIAFEREAYSHDEQEDYMATRPFYNWIGYIKNETKRL